MVLTRTGTNIKFHPLNTNRIMDYLPAKELLAKFLTGLVMAVMSTIDPIMGFFANIIMSVAPELPVNPEHIYPVEAIINWSMRSVTFLLGTWFLILSIRHKKKQLKKPL